MSVCTKCKKNKSETEFNFKNKELDLRHKQCKNCTRLSVKNHYNKNREYYLEKISKRNSELRSQVIPYIREYLQANPCIDCGERDIVVLEFDHKDPSIKLKAVSPLVRNKHSFAQIRQEIDKCEVRCANCHRRKTANQFNWFKTVLPL